MKKKKSFLALCGLILRCSPSLENTEEYQTTSACRTPLLTTPYSRPVDSLVVAVLLTLFLIFCPRKYLFCLAQSRCTDAVSDRPTLFFKKYVSQLNPSYLKVNASKARVIGSFLFSFFVQQVILHPTDFPSELI